MTETTQPTSKTEETVVLEPRDYHWLYHLNELSLKHVDFDNPDPTVPYLGIIPDENTMAISIEPVTSKPPYYISPRIQGIHESLLRKLEYVIPDMTSVQALPDPDEGVTAAVMQALLQALESHVIHLLPLQPETEESICVRCDFYGWKHNRFKIEDMYAIGIDRDATYSMSAVQVATDDDRLYLHKHCLRHSLLWIASTLGIFYNPEWTPWDNDPRSLTVGWFQHPPGTWVRSIDLNDGPPK